MDEKHLEQIDYDEIWKEVFDFFLPHFFLLFFPKIYEEIDWNKGYRSLEQELRKAVPEAAIGKRTVDKLIAVCRKNGEEAWVYIHIEIQSQWDKEMEERMFIYYIRLYNRYKQPIMSLVVLGDDCPNWKPCQYEHEFWGSRLRFEFEAVKLLDYQDRIEELEQSGNPFAFFVIAHLWTLKTKKDLRKRLEYKKALALKMMELGLDEKTTYYLLKFMDMLMQLPEDVEQEYLNEIREYQKEKNMPLLAPFERLAMEEGRVKGRVEGRVEEAQGILLEMLNDRLGEVPASLREAILDTKDLSLLRSLRRRVFAINSVDEFTQLLNENKNGN